MPGTVPPVQGKCPRCGAEAGESRWCPACGKDLRPEEVAEEVEAARREQSWLGEHAEIGLVEGTVEAQPERPRERDPRTAATRPPRSGEYEDPRALARIARGLLYANVAVLAAAVVLAILHLAALDGASDDLLVAADLAALFAYAVTAGFFIAWLYRVYENSAALGADERRFWPGWAILGWFVPIFELFRPKQIVNDVWRASDPELRPWVPRRAWVEAAIPGVLTAWWLTFLLAFALDRASWGVYRDDEGLVFEESDAVLNLVASLASIAAALLAVVVVSRLTARQLERAARIEALPPAPAPVPPGPN